MKKENLKKKIRQLEKRKKEIDKILSKTILREFLLAMNNKRDKNIEKLYQERDKIIKELIDLQLKYCNEIFKDLGI